MELEKLRQLEQIMLNLKLNQPASGDSALVYTYKLNVNLPNASAHIDHYSVYFQTNSEYPPIVQVFNTRIGSVAEAIHPDPGSTDDFKKYRLLYTGPTVLVCVSSQPGHFYTS